MRNLELIIRMDGENMWKYQRTDELYHFGVKGMKWGVRRYQNKDGTLTSEGRNRYIDQRTGQLTKHGEKRLAKVGEDSIEGKHILREKLDANVYWNWHKSYNKAADIFDSKIEQINKQFGDKAGIDNKEYVKAAGKAWKDAYSKNINKRFWSGSSYKGNRLGKKCSFYERS